MNRSPGGASYTLGSRRAMVGEAVEWIFLGLWSDTYYKVLEVIPLNCSISATYYNIKETILEHKTLHWTSLSQ